MFEPDCISKGIRADKEGDFETAIHYYEMSVNSRCTAQRPFDRLISIYRAHKMWDNLVRILRLVVDVYLEENEKMLKRSLVAENKLKYYKEIKEAHEANIQFWGYCIYHKREMCLYNPMPVNKMLLLLGKYTAYEK